MSDEEDIPESIFEIRGHILHEVLEHIPYKDTEKLINDCEAISSWGPNLQKNRTQSIKVTKSDTI